MDFAGKVCPYCKAEFKEGDDVVICSVCEMPHHKECWTENQGCTTFGCTGTIMGADSHNSTLYCTRCGAVYIQGEAFCSGCGNPLLEPGQQQSSSYNQSQYANQTMNNNYGYENSSYNSYNETNIDEDIRALVGLNQEYFIDKFQKLDNRGVKVSWNWASAFLGGFWYAYRKMYKIQVLYYVAYFLAICGLGIASIMMFIPLRHTIKEPSSLIIMLPFLILFLPFLLSGMFANYLYKRHIEKHLQEARSMENYMKQNYIVKHGGVSNGAVWIIIGIRVLFYIISALSRNLN